MLNGLGRPLSSSPSLGPAMFHEGLSNRSPRGAGQGAGYGSSPPLQNGSSQKTRKTKRIRSKAYAISCGRFMGDAFGLGRVRQLRSPSEADSTDSDIVRIQTGRVQKALQLDESQEACLAWIALFACIACDCSCFCSR